MSRTTLPAWAHHCRATCKNEYVHNTKGSDASYLMSDVRNASTKQRSSSSAQVTPTRPCGGANLIVDTWRIVLSLNGVLYNYIKDQSPTNNFQTRARRTPASTYGNFTTRGIGSPTAATARGCWQQLFMSTYYVPGTFLPSF